MGVWVFDNQPLGPSRTVQVLTAGDEKYVAIYRRSARIVSDSPGPGICKGRKSTGAGGALGFSKSKS